MPKAGYSANAQDGQGVRTRLRARVLHLRAGTASLAIVQCDLLGGSSVVQHLVAKAIAGRTDVPLAGLMIGATHTHAGPGQFLGTDFYNRFASNRGGFDPAYTDFLVRQIAGAVIEAVESRSPARSPPAAPRCGASPATARSSRTSTTTPWPTSAPSRSASTSR